MTDRQRVSVRGTFEVDVWTAGDGPPLVFLHGVAGLPTWPDWLDAFAANYRIVAPVLPGFGESTGLDDLTDFLDLTLYHLDLFDTLGVERPVIVGHSLGGVIAAEIAAIANTAVSKLALVDPFGLWDDENPVADIFATTVKDTAQLSWADPEAALQRGLYSIPDDVDAKKVAVIDRAKSLSTAGKFLWPIPDKGLRKRIHRIAAPTLLIWGESDKIVPPSYGGLFQDRIAGSRLVTIPDAGHYPMLERPEPFIAALQEFLG